MALRIGTNVASIAAQNALNKNVEQGSHAMKALSSGKRITQASDDAAGFAISQNLDAQRRGIQQANRNAQDAVSFVQVAEGGLSEQNNILIRQRELAIQAASDTVSDVERGFLDKEFQQLGQELDRIAKTTSFGSNKLLNGEGKTFEFQVGTSDTKDDRIPFMVQADSRASSLGVSGLSIQDSDDALDSLSDIDSALEQINGMRAHFGGGQARLQIVSDHLQTQYENISQAYSQIADADIAQESANLARSRMLQDLGVSILSQANSQPYQVGKLINNI